ncbi:MAG: hypothetical protein ACREGI_02705, partial [Candidatus Levyibacteriota bacterium]
MPFTPPTVETEGSWLTLRYPPQPFSEAYYLSDWITDRTRLHLQQQLGIKLPEQASQQLAQILSHRDAIISSLTDGQAIRQRVSDERVRNKGSVQPYEDSATIQLLSDASLASASLLEVLPHENQLWGALALLKTNRTKTLEDGRIKEEGTIVEVPTGEGKTIMTAMTAAIYGLEGKGVHIATENNDYLALRDAAEMGPLYEVMGLRITVIQSNGTQYEYVAGARDVDTAIPDNLQRIVKQTTAWSRRAAYEIGDVVYGAAQEFGFDYLRDNQEIDANNVRQVKGHEYVIIDEVDRALIDDAVSDMILQGENSFDETTARAYYPLFQRFVHAALQRAELSPTAFDEHSTDPVEEQEKAKQIATNEINKQLHLVFARMVRDDLTEGRDYVFDQKTKEITLIDASVPESANLESILSAIGMEDGNDFIFQEESGTVVVNNPHHPQYRKLAELFEHAGITTSDFTAVGPTKLTQLTRHEGIDTLEPERVTFNTPTGEKFVKLYLAAAKAGLGYIGYEKISQLLRREGFIQKDAPGFLLSSTQKVLEKIAGNPKQASLRNILVALGMEIDKDYTITTNERPRITSLTITQGLQNRTFREVLLPLLKQLGITEGQGYTIGTEGEILFAKNTDSRFSILAQNLLAKKLPDAIAQRDAFLSFYLRNALSGRASFHARKQFIIEPAKDKKTGEPIIWGYNGNQKIYQAAVQITDEFGGLVLEGRSYT